MLHITGSMKTLKKEVRIAIPIVKGIIDILCDMNSPDYPRDISKVMKELFKTFPEFKVLKTDFEAGKDILRKVCTGEISVHDAIDRFEVGQKELESLFD